MSKYYIVWEEETLEQAIANYRPGGHHKTIGDAIAEALLDGSTGFTIQDQDGNIVNGERPF